MKLVELYTPAFPKSRFSEQVAEYAIISLQQMNDSAALAAYGEKALAVFVGREKGAMQAIQVGHELLREKNPQAKRTGVRVDNV